MNQTHRNPNSFSGFKCLGGLRLDSSLAGFTIIVVRNLLYHIKQRLLFDERK